MTLRSLNAVILASCSGVAPPMPTVSGPCDLVEAMLTVDSPTYREMFVNGCGSGTRDLGKSTVVKVVAPPEVFPADTVCTGRSFSVFHDDPTISGMIVQLALRRDGQRWHFIASRIQPNPTELPDGSFVN